MHRKMRLIHEAGRERQVTVRDVVSPSAFFDLNDDVNGCDDLLPLAGLALN